jgi:hypothetical protein
MIARLTCRVLASRSMLIALVLSVCMAGCGEARKDVAVRGVEGTLRMLIANYDDHAETYYRLVTKDDETLELKFAGTPPQLTPFSQIAVRGARKGDEMQVDELDVLRKDDDEQPFSEHLPEKKTFKVAFIIVDPSYNATRAKQRLSMDASSPTGFY